MKKPGALSSGTCYALIARMAMYFKNYDVAIDAAKKVIGSGVQQVVTSCTNATVNSYAELFTYTGELNQENASGIAGMVARTADEICTCRHWR